jgi:hypothetical protein
MQMQLFMVMQGRISRIIQPRFALTVSTWLRHAKRREA